MTFTNSSRRTGVKVQIIIFDITTVFNAANEYESHITYYTNTTMPVVRKAKQYAYMFCNSTVRVRVVTKYQEGEKSEA